MCGCQRIARLRPDQSGVRSAEARNNGAIEMRIPRAHGESCTQRMSTHRACTTPSTERGCGLSLWLYVNEYPTRASDSVVRAMCDVPALDARSCESCAVLGPAIPRAVKPTRLQVHNRACSEMNSMRQESQVSPPKNSECHSKAGWRIAYYVLQSLQRAACEQLKFTWSRHSSALAQAAERDARVHQLVWAVKQQLPA